MYCIPKKNIYTIYSIILYNHWITPSTSAKRPSHLLCFYVLLLYLLATGGGSSHLLQMDSFPPDAYETLTHRSWKLGSFVTFSFFERYSTYFCISTSLESPLPRVNYVTSPTWKFWPNFCKRIPFKKYPFQSIACKASASGFFSIHSQRICRGLTWKESLCVVIWNWGVLQNFVCMAGKRAKYKSHNHLVKKSMAMKIGPFPLPCQSLSKCCSQNWGWVQDLLPKNPRYM